MNVLLSQGNLEEMFKQNAEQKQTAMQNVYREWREAQAVLTDKGIKDNESDYKRILWILCGYAAGDYRDYLQLDCHAPRAAVAAAGCDKPYPRHCRR